MRIRKRFPSSSISSIALSDPQLNRPAMVRHHSRNLHVKESSTCSQLSDLPIQPSSPTSDHHPAIGSGGPRWVFSDKLKELETEKLKEDKWEEEERSNDTGKWSILVSAVGTGLVPPTSSSHQDMAVPTKKRRGSRGEAARPMEKNKNVIMRNYINSKSSKTNKKSVPKSNEDEGKKVRIGHVGARKPRRGGAIMEGSRCSRVNGRGWRCSQSTLVGYSLCEHHLGKGRLRSMASVREPIKLCEASLLVEEEPLIIRRVLEEDGGDEGDESKKRMKLGVVKARSMRSLLGQTKSVDKQK